MDTTARLYLGINELQNLALKRPDDNFVKNLSMDRGFTVDTKTLRNLIDTVLSSRRDTNQFQSDAVVRIYGELKAEIKARKHEVIPSIARDLGVTAPFEVRCLIHPEEVDVAEVKLSCGLRGVKRTLNVGLAVLAPNWSHQYLRYDPWKTQMSDPRALAIETTAFQELAGLFGAYNYAMTPEKADLLVSRAIRRLRGRCGLSCQTYATWTARLVSIILAGTLFTLTMRLWQGTVSWIDGAVVLVTGTTLKLLQKGIAHFRRKEVFETDRVAVVPTADYLKSQITLENFPHATPNQLFEQLEMRKSRRLLGEPDHWERLLVLEAWQERIRQNTTVRAQVPVPRLVAFKKAKRNQVKL